QRDENYVFDRERVQVMIERDMRQIKSMVRLINDMVDVSRVNCGNLAIHPEQMNLSQLVLRIVDDFTQQALTIGSSFHLDITPDVSGFWDDFRIEQIIINLITNALRYGGYKPVGIKLVVIDDMVEVHVQDQGGGISDVDCRRIFEKFARIGHREVKEGLGMGLYIARQLAEAHGGSLTVSSKLGEGSLFTLRLPCANGTSQPQLRTSRENAC